MAAHPIARPTSKVPIDPWAITWLLSLAAAMLVAISLGMQLYRLALHREHVFGLAMMSLDRENNIPAFFSTVLLLIAAALLALIATLERKHREFDASKWAILAAGFVLMSVDEAVSLHEHLINPMRHLLGGKHLGLLYFAWVVPGIALVAALGVFFLPFMFRLPRRTAIAFALSAAIYLGGALGVELFEGAWREGHGHRNAVYHALVTLEEAMEMAGVIFFINALMRHIAGRYGEVELDFDGVRAGHRARARLSASHGGIAPLRPSATGSTGRTPVRGS